ncbi:MAG TPA: sugar kinase [Actinomycetota bacterium]|nr:sugar kinase [Actinomycetota bacterium]
MAADLDLLVLGDANPDLVLHGGDVVPAFGQAEHLVDDARLTIGGSGAILACGAAALGLRVAIAAVVGDDLFGRFVHEGLVEGGVDVSGIVVDTGTPTGVTVVLSGAADRAILTMPGTIASLSSDRIDPVLLDRARHVHVSSYFLQSALTPSLPDVFQRVRARGGTTSVDPNWDPSERWNGGLLDLLTLTDVFLPNAMEATRVAHTSDLDAAAASLAEHAGVVAIKNGDRGAIAVSDGVRHRVDPVRVQLVDSTGAGDSFDAGFLAAWLDGAPVERALAFANVCGALSTRAMGGTSAQATRDEAAASLEGSPA